MIELEPQWETYVNLSIKEINQATSSALKKAAATLKTNTQRNLMEMMGDSAVNRGRYFDTLVDGVRVTKYDKNDGSIAVHVMGSRSPRSGTYRLRFFEGGTVGRTTTGRGNTPYSNKDISPLNFFESAMNSTPIDDIIEVQLNKAVERINKKKGLTYAKAKGRE